MKNFVLSCLLLFSLTVFAQSEPEVRMPGRRNSAATMKRPYVILISADGFRWDFAQRYQAKNLQQLSQAGVTANFLQSTFPSLTFPNHYSIVTGMYPSGHGLVDNTFYEPGRDRKYAMSNKEAIRDSSFYGGLPLWSLAEQQQMLAASYFWVGSEAPVGGGYQTYRYPYGTGTSMKERIAGVKAWLQLPEDIRPHLITFYMPEVDHAAHHYGPESPETGAAVQLVDEAIGLLSRTADSLQLPVNFVVVSDHGMTTVRTDEWLTLPPSVDTSRFVISGGDALLHLYAKDAADIMPTYRSLQKQAGEFDVYLASSVPARWHYSKKDDRYNRIGDILLVPRAPFVFNLAGKRLTPGKHGFDPAMPDMRGIFYAWGPAFKSGKRIGGFENIHVYPLVAHMLGLELTQPVEGRFEVLKRVLK